MNMSLMKFRDNCRSAAAFSLLLGMLLVMSGCSEPAPSATGVTVSIATPDESGDTTAAKSANTLLSAAAISTAYPYLSSVTLQIVASGYTTAGINNDYNNGRFSLAAGVDAISVVDTVFTLNVPNDVDLTFIITAYNLNGFRIFSATSTLTVAQLLSGNTSLPVSMLVDIDPAIPVLATDPGCTGDTDGDGYCNDYEDIFVTSAGVADIDGDGLLNSEDLDADGDGMNDDVDGATAANDGYPSFIHANQAPTAVSLSMTTVSGTNVVGTASVTDPDVGDCHSIAIVNPPTLGVANILATGAIPPGAPPGCVAYGVSYTPPNGYTGQVNFTISATDRGGLSVNGGVSVSVGIAPPTAPTVSDTAVVADEDVPLAITLTGSDINGDTLTFSVVSAPANGTLSGTAPNLSYTSNSNYNGSDSFTFRANDGSADSNIATVSISVNPINDAPVGVDDGARSLTRSSVDSSSVEGNGGSVWPSVNDNGRMVVFWSSATNLVAGDTNGVFDLFMHDSLTGQTSRLSVDSNGLQADTGQTDYTLLHPAAVSVDGRYVVFESTASNLDVISGPYLGGVSQLYLRDTLEGVTTPVTSCEGVGDGDSYEPVMTPDAAHIAFTSLATDPWPFCGTATDTNGVSDVYIDSLTYGSRRVSIDASGLLANNQTNGASSQPTIADAGSLVAFTSTATNLVAVDANGAVSDIFLKNLADESVSLISVDSGGVQASGGNSYSPSISGDGRYVTFVSEATNLVSGDSNGAADIFVHDTQSGQTTRVSVDSAGNQANGVSSHPVISTDGRYVVFESLASNLVADDTNGVGDLFIHDTVLGDTNLLSRDTAGNLGNAHTAMPSFSGDGLLVALATDANNLVTGDANGVSDVIAMSLTDIATTETVAVLTPNVLLNDTDVENDPLSVLGNGAAANGGVTNNGDATFTYTPNAGFVGLDKFSYTLSDGAGGTGSARVRVAVAVANYTPQAVGDQAATTYPSSVIIPVLVNDFDLDNDTLAIATAGATSSWGAVITDNGDGTLTYDPSGITALSPGTYLDTFTYTVTDGSATSLPATVTVTLTVP